MHIDAAQQSKVPVMDVDRILQDRGAELQHVLNTFSLHQRPVQAVVPFFIAGKKQFDFLVDSGSAAVIGENQEGIVDSQLLGEPPERNDGLILESSGKESRLAEQDFSRDIRDLIRCAVQTTVDHSVPSGMPKELGLPAGHIFV